MKWTYINENGNTITINDENCKSICEKYGFKLLEDEGDKTPLSNLSFMELKVMASGKGINTHKMSKEDLLKVLQ